MNPFDILKRTPKTNCGRCGHPTCLAFAAAVAKTGADARRCPFIDLNGLTLAAPEIDDLDNLPRQHDLALIEHLQSKIATLEFTAVAAPLGALCNDGGISLHFPYLGRKVRVSKQGITMDGAGLVDPRDQILLYNYVHSGGGRPPDQSWIGMESLPNSISKIKTLARYGEDRLANCLAPLPPQSIETIGAALGATIEAAGTADLTMTVPVLPMVPQRIIFWGEEPEDGFAAKVKILFDHHVLDFLDLESLVFSAERMAERIGVLASSI
ncbi:MAG: DUF3786 domain-containing protein [Desulfobulbaceae bacterium]|nr:DUF3786 domain-containing protein [Desulfobulbaceae bacterium]